MLHKLLSQFEEHDRRIFWVLSIAFILALAFYLYFLSISVHAVVLRKSAEQEFIAVTSRINILESSYAELDKEISLHLARERGFVDVGAPLYVSAERDAQNVLSLHTGR